MVCKVALFFWLLALVGVHHTTFFFFAFSFYLYIDQHVTHIVDYVSQLICYLFNESREYFLSYISRIFGVASLPAAYSSRADRIYFLFMPFDFE